MFVVDAAAGVLFPAAVAWCAYAVACRMTQGAGASVRLTAAAIVVLWELTAALLLFSAVRLFTRRVVLLGFCLSEQRSRSDRCDLSSILRCRCEMTVLLSITGGRR